MAKIKCVYGAPCSGKTTYVKNHAGDKDIVWDLDDIRKAVTLGKHHSNCSKAQINMVLKLRYTFMVNAEASQAETAWFICGMQPDEFIRDALGKTAEYIEMDTSEEECLQRLAQDKNHPDKAYTKAGIKEYFRNRKKEVTAMPQHRDREYRAFAEFRAINDEHSPYTVTGYACTYDKYHLWGDYYERIAPEAFQGADLSDIIFQYDHAGKIYARTSNNTLQVRPDERGLVIWADLSKSAAAKELFDEIRAGLITKMSFGFHVARDHAEDRDYTRVIDRIDKVYDVSAVSLPANDHTEISVSTRDFFRAVEERRAREALEVQRRKLQLRMKAGY